MYITQHLAVNLILSSIVLTITGRPDLTFLFVIVGSLVDVDHYIYFAVKERNLNPIKSYNFFCKSYRKDIPLIFHSIEFMAIMFLAIVITGNIYIIIITSAIVVHMICDLVSDWKFIGNFRRFRLIK